MNVTDITNNSCEAVLMRQLFYENFRESFFWDVSETIHRYGYSLYCCKQSALAVISEKLISVLAISGRIPGSSATVDGYFVPLPKRSESRGGHCSAIKMPAVKFS